MAVAAIPFILAGVGAAAGTYGAVKQQQAQNEANAYNAMVANRNADLAEMQEQDIKQRGETEANVYRKKVEGLIAQQKSTYAKSGVALGKGSAAEIIAGTREIGEMDAMKIKANAAREAAGLRLQAQGYREEASLQQRRMGNLGETAAVSLLSSAGSFSSAFARR